MRKALSRGTSRRVLTGVGVVVTAFTIFLFWPDPNPDVRALPSPNGFDDLVKAAQLLPETQESSFDYRTAELTELRESVAHNVAALKRLREGLIRECRVPLENSFDYIGNHITELSGHKRLAFALSAEGRLAELEQRPNDAARSYIDIIRLGHEAARGGLLIDPLTGAACEALGSSKLAKIVSTLDANDCRTTTTVLEAIQAKRESPEEILRIERTWSHRNYGLMQRVNWMIASRSFSPEKVAHQQYIGKLQAEIRRQSGILIDLASRAYQLERGRVPTNVNELVPDFLKAVPQTPATTN